MMSAQKEAKPILYPESDGKPMADNALQARYIPQVIFEIWSPFNTFCDFMEKLEFYERYGVEEFYLYDPDAGRLEGWLRQGDKLVPIEQMDGWVV